MTPASTVKRAREQRQQQDRLPRFVSRRRAELSAQRQQTGGMIRRRETLGGA